MPSRRPFSRPVSDQRRDPAAEWIAVEDYLDALFVPPDPVLDAARRASAAAGLPDIAVTPSQGQFLQLLARLVGARRILEVGTLGGYSTVWLARALPDDGRLITLDVNATHLEVARENIARAGLTALVEPRLGPALETLPQLTGPFDFIFIDADKANSAAYFSWCLRLSRPGTLIVVDNVIRDGQVADAGTTDPDVLGIRRLNEAVAAEPRVSAVTLQTVGSKGYDGFLLVRVNA